MRRHWAVVDCAFQGEHLLLLLTCFAKHKYIGNRLTHQKWGERHTMLYTRHQLSRGVSTALKPAWSGSI